MTSKLTAPPFDAALFVYVEVTARSMAYVPSESLTAVATGLKVWSVPRSNSSYNSTVTPPTGWPLAFTTPGVPAPRGRYLDKSTSYQSRVPRVSRTVRTALLRLLSPLGPLN